MKKYILTTYYFLCYMVVRLFSTPLFWLGIPAFVYWVSDTEKTANQIRLVTWSWLMLVIWYFTAWYVPLILTFIAFIVVVIQVFRIGKNIPVILALLFTLSACVKDEPIQLWVVVSDGQTVDMDVNGHKVTKTDTLVFNHGEVVRYNYTTDKDVMIEFISLKYGETLETNFSDMGKTSGKFRMR